MNVGTVLQTIGILTMGIGSILAIEGVRNRIKKVKDETRDEIILADGIARILLYISEFSDGGGQKSGTWLDKNIPIIGSAIFFIDGLLLEIKHTILEFIERIAIRLGIVLIFLGAVIQVVGLWL